MGFKQEIVIDPATGSRAFVVTLEGVMDMNRAHGDRLTELLGAALTPSSREPAIINRVDKDFERLKKDIQSLMKARQQTELQGQRELMNLLDTLEYTRTRITQSSNPVNERNLREFERRGIRRDCIMLGIAIGIPTLITLLLYFLR